MSSELATVRAKEPSQRWRFLRDVLVFQLKMILGSLRDFALVPISLAAALVDLIIRGGREGHFFYKVLHWAWRSEEMINVYSVIKHEVGGVKVHPDYTVDSVVNRIEKVVVREYEKGGTAASIKEALDKVLDQVHRDARQRGEGVRNALSRVKQELKRPE